MIGKTENALGDIILDEAVIARIAATVASGSYGVVGMAHRSTAEGVVNLLKGETASKGIKALIDENNAVARIKFDTLGEKKVNFTINGKKTFIKGI